MSLYTPISAQDVRSISVTKQGRLGQLAGTPDGKIFRYSQAGASTLDPGKLCVNADVDTDIVNKTVARTYAAGTFEVIIDAAGAVAANAYEDGTLAISDATGEGISVLVNGNSVTTGAAELTVTLSEPVPVALTIDVSEATLDKNPWDDIVISATDQADMPVGVPNVSITTLYYGWVQTGGTCAVWADEAVAKGLALTIGTGTAGQVEALDAAGEFQIGVAQQALVDTEYRQAYLTMN